MNRRLLRPAAMALAFIAAVTLALLSVWVERMGPEQVAYGNLCGPTASDPCYRPALKGGFPVAYLYDAPGVSVERRLAFGEDKLDRSGLLLDVILYFAMCMLAHWAATKRQVPDMP